MKRMKLILQKALDVSVHNASLVDLRACLESECRGDEELLAAFFPPLAPESPEHHNTEEVAAQAVLSLRQKVETVFEWLCETNDVDAELLELEDVIKQAEHRRLHQTSPEARVRVERLRAKQEEKKELEALVEALEAKTKELQREVEEKRRLATADVQRMQRTAIQLEEASDLAKNYATAP
ncbi:uncharacterized protein PITG_09676 [Phytophthora infestans T30-4]|uniref:Uncharacterized protein n=1 Tax=Phytophthora infestans (strain T30-4) TaxID=403677 RepID=D0NCJ6_PHYIT|nr:uncharacterized protein PITG_09676 [Phytophthora infestans T30-4]EEY55710.1 conserved hypothetical protein [Phytophthora infestans T30-4]|eukprot:XP_002903286.1 conserved hypothetical protein [Phytophthora infestans T30-4]